MYVDPNIFLSIPGDLPDFGAANLATGMAKAAEGADKIIILSAYFGADYLQQAFKAVSKKVRNSCALTLVFGIDSASELLSTVSDLRNLQNYLAEIGFPSPEVKIFSESKPFHVKLYYFKKATQPNWFIGSANASSAITGNRHEMMMRLRGRHDSLFKYMESVVEQAINVKENIPSGVVNDLRSFLLNGSICYRPVHRLNFSFEACEITTRHRDILKKALAKASQVPHADPQTEGFGFSLSDAVRQITEAPFANPDEDETASGESASRIRFRHMAVETNYGYWVPAAYAHDLNERIRTVEKASIEKLRVFANALKKASDEELEEELKDHIEGLKRFFDAYSLTISPKEGYSNRFQEFLKTRRNWLADPEQIKRAVKRLHVEPMPDIWGGIGAAARFERSFFDDLSWRLRYPKKYWVAGVLARELDLPSDIHSDAVKSALEERLERGFIDSVWWDTNAEGQDEIDE